MTVFEGYLIISIDDPYFHINISSRHRIFLRKFCASRRMAYSEEAIQYRPDPFRENVGLPFGIEGAYYVNNPDMDGEAMGTRLSAGVLDYHRPPQGQPSLFCGWTITRSRLIWSWNPEATAHIEWLRYLIRHFFSPWGYLLNGTLSWFNDVADNAGDIVVANNKITIRKY